MNHDSYGIVVEGDYDIGILEELIWKICGRNVQVESRDTRGRVRYKNKKIVGYLRSFEHVSATGGSVDKVLVVRDTNGKDPAVVEQEIWSRIGNRAPTFPRGVSAHAVRQEIETWLLADHNAINRVAQARNARDRAQSVVGSLEEMQNPKEKFLDVLSLAGLNYTAQVCRGIAREIDLAVLRERCPSFREFERKVLDP